MTRPQQQPLLGILGGMGPLATVDFLGKLTRLVPAHCDQDHLPWLTLSQPDMPDRSSAIRDGDDRPREWLAKGVAWLAEQGVSLIALPCSTSHFWFEAMQEASSVPIMHIADATVEELRLSPLPRSGKVAVLATRGTIRSGMYSARLRAADFQVVVPDEAGQMKVDRIIAQVKAGEGSAARQEMQLLQAELSRQGVAALVLGCTELPLACDHRSADGLPAVDVSLALARACLRRLGYLD
ncbi:aspartate racemase [Paucimonas lemoignei]|uniref:Aspartate racemase n=1 Tax=Paucimonas lemoignei TaxID=29443 RepID=A0A4R3HY36_PAULE|nr:amino acid racemase [Paucimonas lemoignei]TCS37553.1 aspartate racemase [Paucimonas lemoignei]